MSSIEPAVPRLSATVLLLRDDPFEVLMIRRREGDSFGSALVFPGGVVDPADGEAQWIDRLATGAEIEAEQRAIRVAAIREVYEEVGLLAAIIGLPSTTCEAGRPFEEALGKCRLDLGALVPFSRWITPIIASKRFDTHFYLCRAPTNGEPICDGVEAVSLQWARPADLLMTPPGALLFPTRMNLMRLAESNSVDEALEAARGHIVQPILVTRERRGNGALYRVSADAGYPVNELLLPY